MNYNRRTSIHLGLLAAGAAVTGLAIHGAGEEAPLDPDVSSYQAAADQIRPLFEKKKAPQPSDWLAYEKEAGQSFAEYVKANPQRRNADFTKLYLQPIGTFNATEHIAVQKLQEFMKLFFGMEVGMLEKIDLAKIPASAQRMHPKPGMWQISASYVLDEIMLPIRPRDAVAVLAITPSDLWPGNDWNFVFGLASLKERVGVWSTARFGNPRQDPARYLRRVLQIAAHETGHMFGIKHCTAYECGMNGTNHLDESDRNEMVFCPECDAKLWWACQLDPQTRAEKLAAFSRRYSLNREAEQWEKIAKMGLTIKHG